MRMLRPVSSLRNQRGQIIIFVMLSLVFLLVVAGFFASDAARMVSDKWELQSALDAAALAGAGKLGFDDTAFPTARNFTVQFAAANQNRSGTVVLNQNVGNDPASFNTAAAPYGDLLLGIWDPTKPDGIGSGFRFEPSLDGTRVNSVMCRYKRQIPASFFSLWGLVNMNVATAAVATANPPALPPQTACIFPIGLSDCPFKTGGTPSSLGCGVPMSFITSSGKETELPPPGTNTAGWVNLSGPGTPGADATRDAITAAANGTCGGSPLAVGTELGASNGMAQSAFDTLEPAFVSKYGASSVLEVENKADPSTSPMYKGKGWEVWVPIIESDECPAKAINGDRPITGWTRFVMTQVINHGECAVKNNLNPEDYPFTYPGGAYPWQNMCPAPNGTKVGKKDAALRAVFGFYSCEKYEAPPVPTPVPRSALATKLRLVR
jgi:hypothetical protein